MISPLSQSQLSIYLACQGLKESDGNYQLAFLFPLPETIDPERLKMAFEKVQLAHPYMLSRLVVKDGEPQMDTPDNPQPVVPLLDSLDRSTLGRTMSLEIAPESGESGPLVRTEVYRTPEGNYLYFDAHHILFDGASTYLILKDLNAAYVGGELAVEKVSGADVAIKEAEQRSSEAFDEARKWYAETFGPGAETLSRIIPDKNGEDGPYEEMVVELGLDRLVRGGGEPGHHIDSQGGEQPHSQILVLHTSQDFNYG